VRPGSGDRLWPSRATNGSRGRDERSVSHDERCGRLLRATGDGGGAPPTDGIRPLAEKCEQRHIARLTPLTHALFRCQARKSVVSQEDTVDEHQRREYWRRNLRLMAVLLTIWALVSFGAGILFVEPLNEVVVAGFPLGFWFAQQGSIITFVILIAVYVTRMDKLDAEYGIDEYEEEVHHS
jgi:putative solute:sodium symporter small subunit